MIKGKQVKYEFTADQINWARGVKRSGKIDTNQVKIMREIYQAVIDPEYDFCITCDDVVAGNFKRLILLMEASVGCEDLLRHEPKEEKVVVISVDPVLKGVDDQPFEVGEDGYAKQPVNITEISKEKAYKLVKEYLEDYTMEDAIKKDEILISLTKGNEISDWTFKGLAQLSGYIHESKPKPDQEYTKESLKNKTKNQLKTLVMKIKGKKLQLRNKSKRVVIKDALEILNFAND